MRWCSWRGRRRATAIVRLHVLLRCSGHTVNVKRVYRPPNGAANVQNNLLLGTASSTASAKRSVPKQGNQGGEGKKPSPLSCFGKTELEFHRDHVDRTLVIRKRKPVKARIGARAC
jgi:hypothetical protein